MGRAAGGGAGVGRRVALVGGLEGCTMLPPVPADQVQVVKRMDKLHALGGNELIHACLEAGGWVPLHRRPLRLNEGHAVLRRRLRHAHGGGQADLARRKGERAAEVARRHGDQRRPRLPLHCRRRQFVKLVDDAADLEGAYT